MQFSRGKVKPSVCVESEIYNIKLGNHKPIGEPRKRKRLKREKRKRKGAEP